MLPLTAVGFYELYHLTKIEPVYWAYGGFKAAGYYLAKWDYSLFAAIAVAAMILIVPSAWRKLRGSGG